MQSQVFYLVIYSIYITLVTNYSIGVAEQVMKFQTTNNRPPNKQCQDLKHFVKTANLKAQELCKNRQKILFKDPEQDSNKI